MDWREFLTNLRAREDLFDSFPPENAPDYQPALLNDAGVLAAARVAARLLFIVAKRGGSRVDPTALEQLVAILDEALPESAVPHCDDEAARVLDWLETAEEIPPDEQDHSKLPPELDLMLAADIESRVSVARFAIEEEHDLELEYFDEETRTWPRFRCRPIAVEDLERDVARGDVEQESVEGEDVEEESVEREDDEGGAEAFNPTLRVEHDGRLVELPVKNIRWLMPVAPEPESSAPEQPQVGDVLDFPTERLTRPSEGPEADEGNEDDETGEEDS